MYHIRVMPLQQYMRPLLNTITSERTNMGLILKGMFKHNSVQTGSMLYYRSYESFPYMAQSVLDDELLLQ